MLMVLAMPSTVFSFHILDLGRDLGCCHEDTIEAFFLSSFFLVIVCTPSSFIPLCTDNTRSEHVLFGREGRMDYLDVFYSSRFPVSRIKKKVWYSEK